MIKLALTLVATAVVAAPVFADAPAKPIRFERDGITYVATVSEQNGVQTISGHEERTNRNFDLRVIGGHVTGTYGGDAVSYDAPAPARIAARDQ